MTECWKKPSEQLDFLPISNVRKHHFHDVAKYEKISPKRIKNIEELRSLNEMLPW